MPTTSRHRPRLRACTHHTVLALLLALTGASACTHPATPHHSAPRPSTPPASRPPRTPPSASTPPASPTEGPQDGVGPTASQTPAANALTIADRFAHSWIRGDLPQHQWWNGVAPYCDAHLADRLRTTDPSRVPATTLIDPPFARTVTPVSAVFQFATNNGVLIVTCNLLNGRWLVTEVDFSLQDDE